MSEEKKYTPGPWEVKKSPFEVINSDHGRLINEVCSSNILIAALYGDTIDANAHLISAAPDLLEALREVLAWMEDELGTSAVDFPDAYAAIAKADGGE